MAISIKSTVKKYRILWVLLLLVNSFGSSYAQTFNFKPTEASAIVSGDDLSIAGLPYTLTTWCNHFDYITTPSLWTGTTWRDDLIYKSNVAFVKFYVDHYNPITKYQAPVNYTYRMACHVWGFTDPSDLSVFTLTDDTLTINYNNEDNNAPYQDINLKKYNNYYQIKVEIYAIFEEGPGGTLTPATLADPAFRNFKVEASILSQCYDKREYGMGPTVSPPVVTETAFPDDNYLQLNWSFASGPLNPVNYQLEWTYLDDYSVSPSGAISYTPMSDLHYDFAAGSTRVWLDDDNYRIPLVYPSGYLVYRVRAVRPDSILFKYPVYGPWSVPGADDGDLGSLTSGVYHISGPYMGDSLNWKYTVSFAEGGKYKNVASFYDGLLKMRQGITRFNSNLNKLIATNNIYDFEGRPSIKTLPAPVKVDQFRYLHDVDLNSVTGLPYTAGDFDTGSLRYHVIPALSPFALPNLYYSNLNTDVSLSYQKYIPSAEGYPLVQTIFESGYNDRISAQGGAGRTLQIGDSNYVSNEYANASQGTLNSLFGVNSGWNNFYAMTVTRDPNQQYSMTIKDFHGKQVVSSLIGSDASPVTHALEEVLVIDSVHYKQDLLKPDPGTQEIDSAAGTRIADVDYFNQVRAYDSLQYTYQFPPYAPCPGQNVFVRGHYTSKVTDKYGSLVLSQDDYIGANKVDASATPVSFSTPRTEFLAGIGLYHFNKTLEFSPWDVSAALDSFFDVANCFYTKPYFIRKSVEAETFPCPSTPSLSVEDECAKAKWEMMQQLFPEHVYSRYAALGDSIGSVDNSIYTIQGCPTWHCYDPHAFQGGDSSVIIAKSTTFGPIIYRCFCNEFTIRDTCVYDTAFTTMATIKISNLNDSVLSVYVPFLLIGSTPVTGNFYIKANNYNLQLLTGNIFSGTTPIGSVVQNYGASRETILTLPITVKGDSFIANIHGNAFYPTGDSFLFTLSAHYADSASIDYFSSLCHRRYQDTCTVPSLADTITVNGTFYSGLRSMSATQFTSIYREAITASNYSIAEALLPLHPQYCELANCFVDSFKARVFGIPDWQTAQHLNLFFLDSLVAKDPLKNIMTSSGLFPDPADSLRTFRGGAMVLDSFIFMSAYCDCSDSIMFKECYNTMFNYEITHRLLTNSNVKKFYFNNIVGIYFSNRQRFIDAIFKKDGNTCSHCAEARMTLVPSAVITPFPSPADTVGEVAFPTFPTPWPAYGTDSFQAEMDSILAFHHTEDSTLVSGAIDSIVAHFSNCIAGDATAEYFFRDALWAFYYSGDAPNGNYTYNDIKIAIESSGMSLSDICNPYLYTPTTPEGTKTNRCLSPTFYSDAGSLLSNSAVASALQGLGTSVSLTLDSNSNLVHRNIARRLGNIQNVQVVAGYNAATRLYNIYITPPGGIGDSVKIYLHSSCNDIFASLPPAGYSVSTACINTDPISALGVGYINQYGFIATVMPSAGGFPCTMMGWIDSMETMVATDKEASRCVPCTQMRALYTQFVNDIGAYDVKGSDHPFYSTMLANYMNQALQQQYTSSDYETFIQSCALADSMLLPLYVGYSTFKFNSTATMNAFINMLNSIDPDYSFNNSYRDSTASGGVPDITVSVDLNTVPAEKVWWYKANLESWYPTLSTDHVINDRMATLLTSGIIGAIYVDPLTPFSPADSGIVGGPITFSSMQHKALWVGDKFVMRDYYEVIKSPSAHPYDVSRAIYQITAYLYNRAIPGVVFVPHYKSTIDADYFKPEKQAYLSYTYGFQSLPDYEVLDSIQADHLIARIPSYAPYKATYSSSATYGLFSNLYLWNTGMNTSYYDSLQRIINLAHPAGLIFHSSNSVHIPVPAPGSLDAYICSDKSYWYRYFTTGDSMFNVYLAFPSYIPDYMRPQYRVAGPVIPMPGDSLNRHFALDVVRVGTTDSLRLYGIASFVIGRSIELDNLLMRMLPTDNTQGIDTFDNCERQTLYSAINSGVVKYNNYMDSVRQSVGGGLMRHLASAVKETLILTTAKAEQAYTLYSYDRAGNLISTVPPAGVTPIPLDDSAAIAAVDDARAAGGATPVVAYTKQNTYAYTSFNQVQEQKTINGGKTRFWYDAAGRPAFSQNDKQAPLGNYTYNIYDEQGRMVETGEIHLGCPYFTPYLSSTGVAPGTCGFSDLVGGGTPVLVSPDPDVVRHLNEWAFADVASLIRSHSRTDVVATSYDEPAMSLGSIAGFDEQENLRKRVSCVKYFTYLDSTDLLLTSYNYATHYSYDAQGNVKTLTHDYPRLEPVKHRYVRIDYDYDVISGKVNMLSYNRGRSDQFYQLYNYDADNRIIDVQTSSDGLIWKKKAHYSYYEHGPLARIDLGDMRVQGIDYAYTIQGWLKAMNSDSLNSTVDMGHDGDPATSITAYDAVAHTIDYFRDDYKSITGSPVQNFGPVTRNLYNGNIAGQTVAMDSFVRLNKQYVYDQLNRIIKADYATIDPTGHVTGIKDYKSRYTYDKDGNIQTLLRYGNALPSGPAQAMDSLTYYYPSGHDDKLLDVYDESPDDYTNDIRKNPIASATPGFGRYAYDATGNMIRDLMNGQNQITWNLYNKVTTASCDSGQLLFEYDGAGNRVFKRFWHKPVGTSIHADDEYYVRDAQGNILATYKGKWLYDATSAASRTDFALASHDIYGSSRIGGKQYYGAEIGGYMDSIAHEFDTMRIVERVPWYSLEYQEVIKADSVNLYGNIFEAQLYARHVTGQDQYELNDHLGDVLATVSDKRAGYIWGPAPGGPPPVTPGDLAYVLGWKPIVVSKQDYYPFGEYMPGRYKSDSQGHCITTNISTMVAEMTDRYIGADDIYAVATTLGSAGSSLAPGFIKISSSAGGFPGSTPAPGMLTYNIDASANAPTVWIDIRNVFNSHQIDIFDGSILIGSTATSTATSVGLVPISLPIPHSTSLMVEIHCTFPPGGVFELQGTKIAQDSMVSHNVATTVCNGDFYRYGYNGQMKVNEWAGVGNHTTAMFWEYDTRTGRRLNLDPVTNPSESLYGVFDNSPISKSDVFGNDPDWVQKNGGGIEWDKNATSPATTKGGDKYLGKDLSFKFNSDIAKARWDGPLGSFPAGDKLTSTINVKSHADAENNLVSVDITSSTFVHKTGGIFQGDGYFPGQKNIGLDIKGATRGYATFEQHAKVNAFEEAGLALMGYDKVNVAQKLTLGLNGTKLSVAAATDIFPSASLSVNGIQLFRYNQPSYKNTHGVVKDYLHESMKYSSHPSPSLIHLRPEPTFYQRYKQD